MSEQAPIWYGSVSADGERLEMESRRGFKAWLRTLAGQSVQFVLQRRKKKRSSSQNAFWWGVVVPMFAKQCGYLPSEHDAVHDELIRVLLGLKPDSHPALKIRRSSTTLTTQEFNELIEHAQVFAAEKLGMVIPDPDPDWARRERKRAA